MDLVSDFVVRIKNGCVRRKMGVEVKKSKHICDILNCLVDKGFIAGYRKEHAVLFVTLAYYFGEPLIFDVKRVSKPSKRVFYSVRELRTAYRCGRFLVYSTTRGIQFLGIDGRFSDIYEGGEILFELWI